MLALIASIAIAHLVRTTQTGQELMLHATANIAYSFQQVGAVISNLYGIGQWVFSRLAMVFQTFVVGILEGLEFALEKLSKVSDTAKNVSTKFDIFIDANNHDVPIEISCTTLGTDTKWECILGNEKYNTTLTPTDGEETHYTIAALSSFLVFLQSNANVILLSKIRMIMN